MNGQRARKYLAIFTLAKKYMKKKERSIVGMELAWFLGWTREEEYII